MFTDDEKKFQEIVKKFNFRQEDFDSYRPKKYFLENQNETELRKELDGLDKVIKNLPFADELPKYSDNGMGNVRQRDLIQNSLAVSAVIAYLMGRVAAIEHYGDYVNDNRIRISRFKFFGLMMVPSFIFLYTHQTFSPQNMGIYAAIPHEIRIKNQLEYQMNLYQNVDSIIHRDEYPSWEDYRIANNRAVERAQQKKVRIFKENQ